MSRASMLASTFAAEIENFCAQYKLKPQSLSIKAGLSSDCVGQIVRRKHTTTTVNKPTVKKLRDAMQEYAADNPIVQFQPIVHKKQITSLSDNASDLLLDALSMLSREQLTELLLKKDRSNV